MGLAKEQNAVFIFLLMVAGIILLIIGFKTIPRLVNTKLLYEMPCVDKEGTFSCRRNVWDMA